jgi:hypothetical protein
MNASLLVLGLSCTTVMMVAGCIESNPQPFPGQPDRMSGRTDVPARMAGDVADMVVPQATDAGAGDADLVGEVAVLDASVNEATDSAPEIELPADASWPPDAVPETHETTPELLADTPSEVDVPEPLPPECDLCVAPYPGCTKIEGAWVCVQCTADVHCGPGGTCDLSVFTCLATCCEPCSDDADCAPGMICNQPSGTCFDPKGSCDFSTAFCNEEKGSTCMSMEELIGLPGPVPGVPSGLCTCTNPSAGLDFSCLEDGSCPDSECFPGQICTSIPLLCYMMFGDCPVIPEEGGICAGPGLFDLPL